MNEDAPPVIPQLSERERRAAAGSNDGANDGGAREALDFSQGRSESDLRKRATVAEAGRTERFRNHFETIAVVVLYASAIALGALAVTWFVHILFPSDWHWLGKGEIKTIQSLLTGGLLAGLATGHLRKRLGH